ncbi:MAG: hypothetical protein GY940_23135 [bacterium]|nr:hypothetical protein [bacterium]
MKEMRDIKPGEENRHYPLSSIQMQFFILNRQGPAMVRDNRTGAMLMEGDIEAEKLVEGFRQVIRERDHLRSSFHMVKGEQGREPMRRVHDQVKFAVECYESKSLERVMLEFVRPFDISKAPLFRVALVKTGVKRHILVVDMHAIIHDGISLPRLFKGLASFYGEGKETGVKFSCIGYGDYSGWQAPYLGSDGDRLEEQEEYGPARFSGEISVSD